MADEKAQIEAIFGRMVQLNPALADDVISYIFIQYPEGAMRGFVNEFERAELLRQSVRGLNELVYLQHFDRGLVEKRVFAKAGRVLLSLLSTRPLNGNEQSLLLAELEASRPVTIKG